MSMQIVPNFMNKHTLAIALAVVLSASVGASMAQTQPEKAEAAAAAAAARTVRTTVGGPLQAAQAAFREKKFADALAKLNEAEAVPAKTPYETYMIERTRSAVAANLNDNPLVAKSLAAVIATEAYPPEDKSLLLDALTGAYYRLKEHAKVIEWGERALAEPAASTDLRLMIAQSAYTIENFPVAVKYLTYLTEEAEKSGGKPVEGQLRILHSVALKQKDTPAYEKILEKLVVNYPKKEYWADLLSRVYNKPEFPERLMIDVRRLRISLELASDAAEFVTLAQMAMQAGLPMEAKKVLDEGYAKGFIKAEDTERAKLRDNVNKEVAEEVKQAAKAGASAGTGAQALVNNGYNLVVQGQNDAGLAMMEQGVAGTGLKFPEEAKLRLGIAYVMAGKKQKAIDAFKAVTGSSHLTELARVWRLRAGQLAG